MSWKFDSVRTKLPGVLKAAGMQLEDAQVETCVGAIAALMPEGEVYSREETQQEIHAAREEARTARETSTTLLEKVTGMRRDQFAEQDRFRLMQEAADKRLADITKENETLKGQVEPLTKEVTGYREKQSKAVKEQYGGVAKKLDAVMADEANKAKYAARFKFAEAGKELSVEDMVANVEAFEELKSLGVPAFQDDTKPPEQAGGMRPGGNGGSPNRRMTAKELAQKRASMGVYT